MTRDPLLFMASKMLEDLARLPRDQADFEYGIFEQSLSGADSSTFAGRQETVMLLSYLSFVDPRMSANYLSDMPVDVHAWFLDRLSLSPEVMSDNWRRNHNDVAHPHDRERIMSFPEDGALNKAFLDIPSPLCRHLIVCALLEFDAYKRSIVQPSAEGTEVSHLWRSLALGRHSDYLERPIRSRRDTLLFEVCDILLDEAQRKRAAVIALGKMSVFLKKNELPEEMRRSFLSAVTSRARSFGGKLEYDIYRSIELSTEGP